MLCPVLNCTKSCKRQIFYILIYIQAVSTESEIPDFRGIDGLKEREMFAL